jgi:hypothetical protein
MVMAWRWCGIICWAKATSTALCTLAVLVAGNGAPAVCWVLVGALPHAAAVSKATTPNPAARKTRLIARVLSWSDQE